VNDLATIEIPLDEMLQLCAVNGLFFSQQFFPKTVRQAPAIFHERLWGLLDSNHRLIGTHVHRDGAKTSIARMYTMKRIAFGLAHTILYIGKSENHAARSVRWIRGQVEHNKKLASIFQLRKGDKWQDTECEIWHGTDQYPITILGMGITGSVRGTNIDDYRPDLIIIDDVIDEDNSATLEQRTKIEDLILGALKDSLAPATESPDAKMVMLQTPLNKDDASNKAFDDPEWTCVRFGCWTTDTEDLPLEQQESAWPSRWPTETLRNEKRAAVKRNKISLWNREKECRLTSVETLTFVENWLKFYDVLPEKLEIIMAVDPVPPPTEKQIANGLKDKDFEAMAVVGKHAGKFYLLEYVQNKGHMPTWTIAEFFRLATKWRPKRILVETVAYQKTLSWLLKEAMRVQKRYFVIKELDDKRKKLDVISDGLSPVASNGVFYVRPEMFDFITQFRDYPVVSHDDLIEVVARCVIELEGAEFENEDDWSEEDEDSYPALEYLGACP